MTMGMDMKLKLISLFCLFSSSGALDVVISITSPIRDRIYNTRGLRPGVTVDIYANGGVISNSIREHFNDYELCIDYYDKGNYLSCKTLGSNSDLASADLSSFPEGNHIFSAFIRPVEGVRGLLSASELSSITVKVPYSTGSLDKITHEKPEWVIALHYSHDAHVAALHWGEPVYVLELERLVEKRYFTGVATNPEEKDIIINAWHEASRLVSEAIGVSKFDVGVFNSVFTSYGGIWEPAFNEALEITINAFTAKRWMQVDHHSSHAALGFWDAVRELHVERPLILSYDGGGNDGFTLAFAGSTEGAKHVIHLELPSKFSEMNFGNAYASVGAALPEVARSSCPTAMRQLGYCNDTTSVMTTELGAALTSPARLALSGKLMGYAGLGTVRQELVDAIEREFKGCSIYGSMINENGQFDGTERCMDTYGTVHAPGGQPYLDLPAVLTNAKHAFKGKVPRKAQRDMAASAQKNMENQVVSLLSELLVKGHPLGGAYDGIVLTGGCGLNVRVNSVVAATFSLPVHVAAAPSDCGLAIGSGWLVSSPNPIGEPFKLHLLGPNLFDIQYEHSTLNVEDSILTSSSVASLLEIGGIKINQIELAELLEDEQVIGVVRGRSEHGPRALGHRSLLSFPSAGMKERMNALKAREWYRPVAPMVVEEEADNVFIRDSISIPLHSPFMSFAPFLKPEATKALPAVTHADNSARPQTVSKSDDSWLHSLLLEVKKRTGWAVLINTSFNTKGKPILNTVEEALTLLRDCEDLDYVLIEDILFAKSVAFEAVEKWKRRRRSA